VGPLKAGAAVASVVAGPKLYALVQSGDLSTATALLRWAAVVAACSIGAAGIGRIVTDYERQRRTASLVAARLAAETPVVLEGTAIQPASSPPRLDE
jgi:hypothetical protein